MATAQTTTHGTLLARVADPSDQAAWTDFCAQYEELIRAFARRQGVFGADADDVVQEVLLALTKALPGFEYSPAKCKFRSYLKTVVVRAIHRRREREGGFVALGSLEHKSDAGPGGDGLDEVWEEEWRQQHLRRALRRIESDFNAQDVRCFRAYVLEGENADAVAERMSVNVGQVYQVKHRMLSRLRDLIAEQVEDEG